MDLSGRRRFVARLGSAVLVAFTRSAPAQARVYRVGLVSHVGGPLMADYTDVFRKALQASGYAEGRNLVLDARFDGETGLRELLRSKPDVLVAAWSPMSLAAKRATTAIPIVAVGPRDPVEQGLVRSLAKPGGNVTGIASTAGDAGLWAVKQLEVLKEIAPRVSHVAYLTDLAFPGTRPSVHAIENAAPKLGLVVRSFDVRSAASIERAFPELVAAGYEGVVVAAEVGSIELILALAAKHRTPAIYVFMESVRSGGLVAYGLDRPELFRRAAYFVDRILKGAKPSELPFEQPTRFAMAVNLKTARALGLSVPQSVLLRADLVVE